MLFWIRVVRTGTLVLLLILEGWLWPSFSPRRVMLMGSVCMAFIMLEHILSISTLLRIFIINVCWILSSTFSASTEMIVWCLSFILLMLCVTLTDLWMLNHSCIQGISPTWSWCVILLMYCLICFANNFVEDFFHLYSSEILASNSLFFFTLSLVLVSGWCWPHKMSLEMFPLQFFGIVWEGLILNLLWMFSRIHLWGCLFLNFCFLGSFLIPLSFLIQSLYYWLVYSYSLCFYELGLKSLILRICPFLLGSPICWYIVIHNILL